MVIEPAFGTFGSVGRCQVLLENEISFSIKLVSRRKHEVLFLLSPGKMLLTMFLVQKWLGSSFPEDV